LKTRPKKEGKGALRKNAAKRRPRVQRAKVGGKMKVWMTGTLTRREDEKGGRGLGVSTDILMTISSFEGGVILLEGKQFPRPKIPGVRET